MPTAGKYLRTRKVRNIAKKLHFGGTDHYGMQPAIPLINKETWTKFPIAAIHDESHDSRRFKLRLPPSGPLEKRDNVFGIPIASCVVIRFKKNLKKHTKNKKRFCLEYAKSHQFFVCVFFFATFVYTLEQNTHKKKKKILQKLL